MYGLTGSLKAVTPRARLLIAAFGECRETRPVGGHGLAH